MARAVATWGGGLVSCVAPYQTPCLLCRTSLWPTMADPRSMASSRSLLWSGAPRWTGGRSQHVSGVEPGQGRGQATS